MQGARVRSLIRELEPTCTPQLRVRMPQLRRLRAATKTRCNQINKQINIFLNNDKEKKTIPETRRCMQVTAVLEPSEAKQLNIWTAATSSGKWKVIPRQFLRAFVSQAVSKRFLATLSRYPEKPKSFKIAGQPSPGLGQPGRGTAVPGPTGISCNSHSTVPRREAGWLWGERPWESREWVKMWISPKQPRASLTNSLSLGWT